MPNRIFGFLNRKLGSIQSFIKDRPDLYAREFIAHNRKVWRDYRFDRSQGEILIEANRMGGCNVAMSYVASYLGRMEKAELVVYSKGVSRAYRAFYRSYADAFHIYSADEHCEEVESLFAEVYPRIKTKRDLENLRVHGILIGDLVYDSYIRRLDAISVDMAGQEFGAVLREALGYLIHWRAYFASHSVKAVLISHGVFSWPGVIMRVAVSHSAPVYLVQMNRIYYVTNSHNGRPYNEYVDHPRHFAELSGEEQAKALAKAEEGVMRRLRGERDVGAHHLLKPIYSPKTGQRVLAESPRIKVLVATHCFSDDNHVYGNNLFPDFHEWLLFLGAISERTDYDWYLRLHPDRYPWETKHVEALAEQYPRFRVLPSETSHNQIVEDGIGCVLTVYGTIGFEYAALGVPVITASPWNPTVAYDFNIHPKTVEEYERILMNLGDVKLNIDINKVYEYYYCHYIDGADDWLYDDFSAVYGDLYARNAVSGSLGYRKFMDQFSDEKHARILETVEKFVRSKDYCLRRVHFSRKEHEAREPV